MKLQTCNTTASHFVLLSAVKIPVLRLLVSPTTKKVQNQVTCKITPLFFVKLLNQKIYSFLSKGLGYRQVFTILSKGVSLLGT